MVDTLIRNVRVYDGTGAAPYAADVAITGDRIARIATEAELRGSIEIDGTSYEHDVIIDRGEVHKRKKGASKKFREAFGHTPLSVEEEIPWKC